MQNTGTLQWSAGSSCRTGLRTDFKSCFKKYKLCKFICCFSCTFCNRAAAKERHKSSVCTIKQSSAIKICEQCFVCRSLVFCKSCSKCPKCCSQSSCRGQASTLLGKMVGSGCKSNSSSNPEGGLSPPLPDPTQPYKKTHSYKLLCKSPQEQLPDGGIASAYNQKCSRTRSKSKLSRLLQPAISSPKAKPKMEAYTGSEQTQSFSQGRKIQNGNPRDYQNIPSTRGMGHFDRFQRCLLPYTHKPKIQKISQISCSGQNLPIQSTSLRSLNSSHGVHCDSKRGKTYGHEQGYKDPPVPRRLVGKSQFPPSWSHTYPNFSPTLSGTRLVGKCGKIRARTQTGLRFCRLPVRPSVRKSPSHPGPVASSPGQDTELTVTAGLSGPAVHVLDRPVNSHRKASTSGSVTHETYTMASQKQLEGTRIPGEDYPNTQFTALPLKVVAGGGQCSQRSTITPLTACSANLYRRIKRRLGHSLKRTHCKGVLVSTRKQTAHKLSRVESSSSGTKRVPGPLCKQYSSSGHRQYHSGGIHKQRRGHEVRPSLCPTMENSDLVYQETGDTESPTHPRSAKRGSRQAIQIRTNHSNRVVSPSTGIRRNMYPVASSSNRPFCHQVQQQTTSLCVTLPMASAVDALSLPWGNLDPYAFPPTAILGKVVEKLQSSQCSRIILIAPGWPNMPWFWDLVAMSSRIPLSLPKFPNLLTQPFNQTHHRNLTSLNLHVWLLEPQQSRSTVSLKQWQQELRLLREGQPDQYMKQNGPFLQSGASLIRWTSGHPL